MSRNNDLRPTYWWPAWATQIAYKLNSIHADQEKIMQEVDDLKAGMANLKKEVGEAVAKFSEQFQALQDAIGESKNLAELRAGVKEVLVDMEGTAKHLDEKFGTGEFTPSGVAP